MKKRNIEAIRIEDGKTMYFDSIKECSEVLGCSLGLVNRVLSTLESNKWYKSAKGYSLSYMD